VLVSCLCILNQAHWTENVSGGGTGLSVPELLPDWVLSSESLGIEFEELSRRIRTAERDVRQGIIRISQRRLRQESVRRRKAERLPIVRALVALFPESLATIHECLKDTTSSHVCEVHFSLFCYLDHTQREPRSREVLAMLEEYLHNVKSNAGLAPWMAGHLLGDHWEPEGALPVLLKAAAEARFATGRFGALSGLEEIVQKLAPDSLARVSESARRLTGCDRSQRIRAAASRLVRAIDEKPRDTET
jgi:hypothetical protein